MAKRKLKTNDKGQLKGEKVVRKDAPTVPPEARETRVWVDDLSEVQDKAIFVAARAGQDRFSHQGTITLHLAGQSQAAVDHALRWFADHLFPSAIINGRVMHPITLADALGQS